MNSLAFKISSASAARYQANDILQYQVPVQIAAPLSAATPKYDIDVWNLVKFTSLSKLFEIYSGNWVADTYVVSSPPSLKRSAHFEELLSLGKPIIPMILNKIENGKDRVRWMVLLDSITGVDPVPAHKRGVTSQMAEEWIKWGRINKFIK